MTGNRLSGARWARILRGLGHRVTTTTTYEEAPCDILIALHARRSHDAIVRFSAEFPEKPLIVVLTGTDLYRDIHRNRKARQSLERATRLVVLQRMGIAELPDSVRGKTRVIYQSAPPLVDPPGNRSRRFAVSVVGHLRSEKDPLRTAIAARSMPGSSKLLVSHMGRGLSATLAARARKEQERNPRYRWLGELPHWRTRRILARSHLLSLTSRMEGSSNALCEALASKVPVVASRISGLIGTLGEDYPGYFEPGDTAGLTQLLVRAEQDQRFYGQLAAHCAKRTHLIAPERERAGWRDLIEEVSWELRIA